MINLCRYVVVFFFFKQKTAYVMRISDWSSDVCSSDLAVRLGWMRLLERLVDCGVDLDARDGHGMTALHLCAALSREAALKLLVSRGASPAEIGRASCRERGCQYV